MHQHGGGNRTTEIGYKEKKIFIVYTYNMKLGLVADPVIEAMSRQEFEDDLRMGVLPGCFWYPCGGCT